MATIDRFSESRGVGQDKSLILVAGALAAIAAFVVALTAPVQALLGEGAYAITSAMHGTVAMLFMATVTIGVYFGYRLLTGQVRRIGEIRLVTVLASALSLMTIVFGNWIYIGYRGAGGPREFFLQNAPEIHKIFFEFKEFMALFTLPLAVTAAYIAIRYGSHLRERPRLRMLLALVLALVFFYFMITFGLGAAITKIKAV